MVEELKHIEKGQPDWQTTVNALVDVVKNGGAL